MEKLELINAAKRRLKENASVDSAADDSRVSFRIKIKHQDGNDYVNFDYYVPELFHLSKTMQEGIYTDICMHDLLKTKKVSEVYKNEGFKSDLQYIRMYYNWPIRNIKIIGKIISFECKDDVSIAYIDDGSFERGTGCIEVQIDKYVWAMMEVESSCIGLQKGWSICVYGFVKNIKSEDWNITIKAERVAVVGKNDGNDLIQQIHWWGNVLNTRDKLSYPWVIDTSTQDAMEALKSLEHENEKIKKYELNCNDYRKQIEIIDLDEEDCDMKVINSKSNPKIISMDEYSITEFSRRIESPIGTTDRLIFVVLKELTRYITVDNNKTLQISKLYDNYNITVVLNGLVLSEFLESSVNLMNDDQIYQKWKEIRLRESKQFLLRSVLEKFSRVGIVKFNGDNSLLLDKLSDIFVGIKNLFKTNRGDCRGIPMKKIREALWEGAPRAAALAVTASLTSRALKSGQTANEEEWVFDDMKDSFYRVN